MPYHWKCSKNWWLVVAKNHDFLFKAKYSSKNLKTINKIQAINSKELQIFCELVSFLYSRVKKKKIWWFTYTLPNTISPAKNCLHGRLILHNEDILPNINSLIPHNKAKFSQIFHPIPRIAVNFFEFNWGSLTTVKSRSLSD